MKHKCNKGMGLNIQMFHRLGVSLLVPLRVTESSDIFQADNYQYMYMET